MNRAEAWELVREVAHTLEFGEDPIVDLPDGVQELDQIRAYLHPIAQAVRLIQSKTLEGMQPHLGARGFAKLGDRVYRAAPEFNWKLREETANEFWQWVRDEDAARQLFNPHDSRIGQLRDLGDHWIDRETGEVGWDAFSAHFLDVELGAVKVSEMPANKALQFIQKADDGTVEHRQEKT